MSKKLLALALSCMMLAGMLAGCGNSAGDTSKAPEGSDAGTESTAPDGSKAPAGEGAVYYLNFKPEQNDDWQALAEAYTAETGVPVTVVTAASGQYETTLMAEMGKSEAPTLFQVNGPVGLNNWKDYCYDLTGSKVLGELTSDDFALKSGSEVAGIGYVIETYGIIVNTKLLEKAGYTTADIQSFADLKKVADDIQARKDELGVKGAFTSAGMDSSSDWRFKTHLANLPIYFEYQADGIGSTEAIKGSFLDNYRQIWDLYITDATCAGPELSAKTGDDAVAEFVNGEAVFYQNGTWAYNDVKSLGDDSLAMIPLYFMYWCVTSDEGTTSMASDMGFVIPFKAAKESENLFVKQDAELTASGKTPVTWNFTTMPSEEWKNGVGSALTAYAADPTDGSWEAVKTAFVDGWATEYQLANG